MDSITPSLFPEIQVVPWRGREIIIIEVSFQAQPFFIKKEGPEEGVYVRFGSTNRKAGPEIIEEIKRLARNQAFDKQPCLGSNSEDIDLLATSELFLDSSRKITVVSR